MSKLISKARRLFDSYDCFKGANYYNEDRVKFNSTDGTNATFTVFGSTSYEVNISFDHLKLNFSCSCPYYKDGNNCKHIWASILKADELHIFDSEGPRPNNDSTSIWKKKIIRAFDNQRSQPHAYGWKQTRSRNAKNYLFAVNQEATKRLGRIRLDFYCREILKNGGLGAVKPIKIIRDDIPLAPDPSDQEILWCLLGKTEQDAYFSYSLPKEFSHVALLEPYGTEILKFPNPKIDPRYLVCCF